MNSDDNRDDEQQRSHARTHANDLFLFSAEFASSSAGAPPIAA
jgi:hypothetical protein